MVFFHSKSACGVQRHLGNFADLERPLLFLAKRFRTVEHAFQASKWMFTKRGRRIDLFAKLAVGGAWGDVPAAKAKGKGGKGEFKRQKEDLDMTRWEKNKTGVMAKILRARADVDPLFRAIVARAKLDGAHLIHYESTRGSKGKVPFWGVKSISKKNAGYLKGENTLGTLMMVLHV